MDVPLTENVDELRDKLRNYDFAFENLCFEGGGVKGVGHIGIIQVSSIDSIY